MSEERQMLRAVLTNVEQLNAKFEGFKLEVNERFDGLDSRFDRLEMKIDNGFRETNHRLDRLDTRTTWLDEDLKKTREKLRQIELIQP